MSDDLYCALARENVDRITEAMSTDELMARALKKRAEAAKLIAEAERIESMAEEFAIARGESIGLDGLGERAK